jgi:hypothetical protein
MARRVALQLMDLLNNGGLEDHADQEDRDLLKIGNQISIGPQP